MHVVCGLTCNVTQHGWLSSVGCSAKFTLYVFCCCSGSFCYLLKLWRSLKFDLNMMVESYLHWMNGAEGKYADTSHVAQLWQQLGVILRDLEMFPEVSANHCTARLHAFLWELYIPKRNYRHSLTLCHTVLSLFCFTGYLEK